MTLCSVIPLHQPAAPRSAEAEERRVSDVQQRLVSALDWLEQGVMLVDRCCRVVFASGRARELLDGSRGVAIAAGRLQVRSPTCASELRRLIADCAAMPGEECRGPLCCRVGEPALSILVMPAARTWASEPGDTATLFLVDPDRASPPSAGELRGFFGLTGAEAEVALDLVAGHSLKACAGRRGVSLETVRSHLRNIFAKTDTQRQAQLVAKLLLARHGIRPPR